MSFLLNIQMHVFKHFSAIIHFCVTGYFIQIYHKLAISNIALIKGDFMHETSPTERFYQILLKANLKSMNYLKATKHFLNYADYIILLISRRKYMGKHKHNENIFLIEPLNGMELIIKTFIAVAYALKALFQHNYLCKDI